MKNKKQGKNDTPVISKSDETPIDMNEIKNAKTEVPTSVNRRFKFKYINGVPVAGYE